MPNVRPGPWQSKQQLARSLTPNNPGEGERIPWTWFDTVTYVSGTSVQLDFFQTVQANKTLGNMQAAGQIPNPMFFILHHIGVAPLLSESVTNTASATGVNTGANDDMQRLITGTASLVIAQKDYWQGKISMLPAGIGVEARISNMGTLTAQAMSKNEFAVNGIPDLLNRQNWWGDLVIPPTQNFLLRLNFSAALTLAASDTAILAYMEGYLVRRVL